MALALTDIVVGPGTVTLDSGGTPIPFEATVDGATISFSRDVQNIEVDELLGPIDVFVQGEDCTVQITTNQVNAEKLKAAFGHGSVETVVPAAGVAGADVFSFGGAFTITEHTLQYKAPSRKNPALNIIIDFYRVVVKPDGDLKFGKKSVVGVPVTFQVLEDITKPEGERLGKISIETAEAI